MTLWRLEIDISPECAVRNKQEGFDDNIIETFNPVMEMLSGINTRTLSEKAWCYLE